MYLQVNALEVRLNAKDGQPAEARRQIRKEFPSELSEGTNPANMFILNFWSPEL